MSYEVIGHSANREEWLELRRTGIGGSDAPAILGLVNWASPSSVQADKWGLLDEPDDAEVLKWGRLLEPAIIEGLAEEVGLKMLPYGSLLRSREHPFMICTPDAHGWDDERYTFAQVKNTVMAEEWAEKPPERVWVQVQHEMAVTGADRCIAAALVMGRQLRWCWVERDQSFIDKILIPAEYGFWQKTLNREPVDPDGSEHTKRALQALYPQDSGETVALDAHFLDLDAERVELLEIAKTAKARLDAIDNQIRHAMKDATYGVLPNGTTFSLKSQTRKAYTVKESTFRVLRRKEPK